MVIIDKKFSLLPFSTIRINSILCDLKIQTYKLTRTRKQYRTWFWNYIWRCSIPILIALAKSENMAGIVGAAVYGFCFFTTFHFSTLPWIQHTQAKHTLEILDHISIYFLIAGTYTPFFTYVYAKFFWFYRVLTVLGIIYTIFF
jgi:channel protein (hemolysin III family)